MSFKLAEASREQSKLRIGIFGPSGSGKTFSALLMAYGLVGDWSKVAFIDTERGSAKLYANYNQRGIQIGRFLQGDLDTPFSPEKYISAIVACQQAGAEAIVIDSITHEWEYILDEHAKLPGNSFANWKSFTPRHNRFIDSILQSPTHMICCCRTKQEYVLSDKNGRQVPEKVGLKAVTRDGFDYEMTACFDLDIKHNATASKDRTSLFADQIPFVISVDTGKQLLAWMNEGEPVSSPVIQPEVVPVIETLKAEVRAVPEPSSKPLCPSCNQTALSAAIINHCNKNGISPAVCMTCQRKAV